jgi:hypothetical protein
MEKEILTKIYLLRKVKPTASFVERTRENIFGKDVALVSEKKENIVISEFVNSFFNVFANSVFQSRMAVVSAFTFLLVFGILAYPLLPIEEDYDFAYIPDLGRTGAEGPAMQMLTDGDDMTIEVATTRKPIEKEFAAIEDVFVSLQRQVLGSMIPEEEKDVVNLTDKDIVNYHVAKIEESETNKDDERISKIKEASDGENYGEAFNMIVDILAE